MAEPTTIGKYSIIRKIGQGGMGRVYAATHPTLKRTIIIKQLLGKAKAMMTKRFLREASLMLDFRHDNIVPVYDHFKEGGSYYIAMEYVQGRSLEDLIEEKGRLTAPAAMLIFREICKGLGYAHDRGVIHRDIKPDNVLISDEGAVKLADFGIATAPDGEGGITKTGVAMGTPAFMSPEQITDAKNVDKRSDIYSMGVMLYQMLTGKKPFPGSFSAESINKIAKGIYVKPRKINREIPPFLRRMVRKAMHHKQRRRYRDLHEMVRKLSRKLPGYGEPFTVNAAIQEYVTNDSGPLARRRLAGQGLVRTVTRAAAAVAVIVGLVVYAFQVGWVYEVLQPRRYGAVEIAVTIPKDYYKPADRAYAHATVVPVALAGATGSNGEATVEAGDASGVQAGASGDGAAQITEYRLRAPSRPAGLPFLRRVFLRAPPASDAATAGDATEGDSTADAPRDRLAQRYLTSGTRYLPAGHYRINVRVENKSFVKSLYIHPREVQRNSLETRDGRAVSLFFPSAMSNQIDVVHHIRDAETGQPISRTTKVYMWDRGRWIDWDEYKWRYPDYLNERLVSNREYLFRYEIAGYYPKELEFGVEADADALDLEIDLMPKPGRLVIDCGTEGLDILLNNKKGDYMGTETRAYTVFGTTTNGTRGFDLPAGEYVLVLKKGSRVSGSHQLVIRPETVVGVTATYDEEARRIVIQ